MNQKTNPLRIRFQDSPVVFGGSMLVAGLLAGIAFYEFMARFFPNPNCAVIQQIEQRFSSAPQTADPEMTVLSNDIANFVGNGVPSAYRWEDYTGDVETLYSFAERFEKLLQKKQPTLSETAQLYSELDEAAGVLSLRAQKMHDSGAVRNDTYDTHVFVGPGWFRICLEQLRLAHQHGQDFKPSSQSIQDFATGLGKWKTEGQAGFKF
jgi:hypothetical protein